MAQYVYTMHRLSKVVPPKREILKNISLSFFPGAKIGVLGLNGAGKSTLLRIMAGVDTDGGEGGLLGLAVFLGTFHMPRSGAIVGGLIIGVGEKLSEVYLGPFVGGGIEIWFAYVLALVFLLFRPQGLFGEKIIDRV